METIRLILESLPGVWKHRYLGLLTAIFCGVLGALAVSMIPSKYEAGARAYVDTESILGPLLQDMAVRPDVEQQLRMMARALLSRPNLEEVAQKNGLFAEAKTDDDRRAIVTGLGVDVKFKPEGRSDFFNLTYRHKSPEVANNVVSSLLEMFVKTIRGDQRRDNVDALAFLDEQIGDYEDRLQKAEQALKEFKVRNIDVLPNLGGKSFSKSAEAQKEYEVARVLYREALNRAAALRDELSRVPRTVPNPRARAAAPAALPTATESRLSAARKRLDDLSTRYTDRHPDVQNTRRIIVDLERQVARERRSRPKNVNAGSAENLVVQNKLYQDIALSLSRAEGDAASLRARTADAKRRAEKFKAMTGKIPKVEAEFAQLNRDYDGYKSTYDKLVLRRESAQLTGKVVDSTGAGDFRVVDPPNVGTSPIWPNRPLFLMIVLGASLVAGMFAATMRHLAAPSYYNIRSIREVTGRPVLGEVGMIKGPGGQMGTLLSTLTFWLLAALFVLSFLVVIAWLMVGQYMEPSNLPEFLRPFAHGLTADAGATDAGSVRGSASLPALTK